MNAVPSAARRRGGTAWYVYNATLMLNRYLMQPDQANKPNLIQFLDDYANAVRCGDVELPMLPT
jgi:hypothetical protein